VGFKEEYVCDGDSVHASVLDSPKALTELFDKVKSFKECLLVVLFLLSFLLDYKLILSFPKDLLHGFSLRGHLQLVNEVMKDFGQRHVVTSLLAIPKVLKNLLVSERPQRGSISAHHFQAVLHLVNADHKVVDSATQEDV
jgi:hypothetical protein